MKSAIMNIIFVSLLIACIPFISVMLNNDKADSSKRDLSIYSSQTSSPQNNTNNSTIIPDKSHTKKNFLSKQADNNTFRIYDKATDKIIDVSDFDFCCGALATEIDTNTPAEAIKAQAVTVHTYYSYLRNNARASKKSYDFECNSKIWQTYVTKEELKEKWGETYDDSYKTISNAVKEVSNIFVLYNDKLCMTKYFKISSGNTTAYSEIYNENIPYLVGVPSAFDTVANNYKTKLEISKSDFDEAIKNNFYDYKPTKSTTNNITDIKKNDYNAVLELTIGNKTVTGKQLMEILNLRSFTFDVNCNEDKYIFTVYGYGENIGMSQYGAYCMAKQGSSYSEILAYYYPNTSLSRIKAT
ncbi:MAG: SpoIID/LytB domain-containing protein [Acutalibacteraceae bacterium]|nr:SpoIID/LytB domain-containing protein [Acutalibacteraceae bacterium]